MNRLKKIITLIPFFFLGFYQASLHAHPTTIKMTIEKIIHEGPKRFVILKLSDKKTHQAITLNDLKKVHTQKIHMLVIDESLTDYSHAHPVATKEAGVYEFTWEPKKNATNYKIWADLVPVNTNQQEYIVTDLYRTKKTKAKVTSKLNTLAKVEGYTFKLAFEPAKLEQQKAAMGEITIYDAKGKPVHNLAPLMGAFAHIVAFSEDFKTVLHVHPMGKEPTKASDRGGPTIRFHLEPQHSGYIKLFAQIKIDGKEIIAPFGLKVV